MEQNQLTPERSHRVAQRNILKFCTGLTHGYAHNYHWKEQLIYNEWIILIKLNQHYSHQRLNNIIIMLFLNALNDANIKYKHDLGLKPPYGFTVGMVNLRLKSWMLLLIALEIKPFLTHTHMTLSLCWHL